MAKKSIFFDSMKRDLGKNTGKAISNKVFGDSWTKPIKRINANSSNSCDWSSSKVNSTTKIIQESTSYSPPIITQSQTNQYDVEMRKISQEEKELMQKMSYKEREHQIKTDDDIRRLEKGLHYDNTKFASRHQARVQAKEIYPFLPLSMMFFILMIPNYRSDFYFYGT